MFSVVCNLLFLYLSFADDTAVHQCKLSCSTGSCCEASPGEFRCCDYLNGVCCLGGTTCCPQGSICTTDGNICEYPNGFATALSLKNVNTAQPLRAFPTIKSKGDYVICSDRTSACPDDYTCCPFNNGSFGCCNSSDAVCCGDHLHCCPRGTKCNEERGSCESVLDSSSHSLEPSALDMFWPKLGNARTYPISSPDVVSGVSFMSYDGVKCDESFECPRQTTCCRNATNQFACCPLPNAVCCADKVHCCPQGTVCNLDLEMCLPETSSISEPLMTVLAHRPEPSMGHQLCPDGHSVCLDEQTCCRLADNTWGCCPLPDAVCCSDGDHCCPSGFKCDIAGQKCTKNVIASPSVATSTEVVCPNAEFRCDDQSTCCLMPNGEWGCCPFTNAVCCSDKEHCCPEHTTCDVAHDRCVKEQGYHDSQFTPLVSMGKDTAPQHSRICSSKLISCPSGSCCKNIFGVDACCPHPEGVCCRAGFCCPKGHLCDDSSGTCSPVEPQLPTAVPWMSKVPARHVSSTNEANADVTTLKASDILCSDHVSICADNRTCCLLIDGSYGCCPLANAVCCGDRRHCCPQNSKCTPDGNCVLESISTFQKSPVQAELMVPITNPPIRSSHLPENNVKFGEVLHATFCGACSYDWLCCPDASGLPNRMCCPSPGSVCCSDGKHCCPKGTICSDDGQCVPFAHNKEISSAVVLGPAKRFGQIQTPFLHPSLITSEQMPAIAAKRARVNVLFLWNRYYRDNSHRHTVCPDRERYCELNEKCCASSEHGYVCVPQYSVCCYTDVDKWCPLGSYCSGDYMCKRQSALP